MTEPAIDIRGLGVRAGGREILAVDRLTVAPGEMVGLLGPNGAGKTTLLHALLAMQGGAGGEVRVHGRRADRLGFAGRSRLRREIGYVPQILAAGGEVPLTVREVVAIGRSAAAGLGRRLSAADHRIVDHWISRLDLSALAERRYGDLSGGERRKTLIARAMAQKPRMLLLDEPAANLDLNWRERLVGIVEDLYTRSDRLTVVLVCHELEVLPACCRRVVLLTDGQVADDGPPEAVFTPARAAELYGPALAVRHRAGRHAVVPRGLADG